jgi:hypothetical protein
MSVPSSLNVLLDSMVFANDESHPRFFLGEKKKRVNTERTLLDSVDIPLRKFQKRICGLSAPISMTANRSGKNG